VSAVTTPAPTPSASAPAGAGDGGGGGTARLAGYRPHLDGLRTVAVYLVVVFHAGADRLAGGFIGVDVFFVLSGYLVTQVLLRDLTGNGRIRFGRFYARRFRRLLPASAVVLVATAVAFSWVASPGEVAAALDGFRAAFLYVANWFFIREATDYFAAGQSESPVLHFWSLAVEEQFYLVWPLALGGLSVLARRAGRHARHALRASVALIAVASLGWAWHLSTAAPDRAYYGTDARVYQLLAGALVALTPALVTRARRLDVLAGPLAGGAVLGLLVASTDVLEVRPVFRGVIACVLTVALIVGLERAASPVRSFLSWRPMVELGRVSYGTYLWHWPVIIVAGRLADLDPFRLSVVAIAVSTGLAALSATLVEQPFRESATLDRVPRVVVVAGLSISLLGGLVVVDRAATTWSGNVRRATTGESSVILTPVPADFDELAVYEPRYSTPLPCNPGGERICTILEGNGPHVVLVGDSNAVMVQGAVYEMAKAQDLTFTLMAVNACPWEPGYLYAGHADKRERCEKADEVFYETILPELDPDLVIAIDVREGASLAQPAFTGTPAQRALRAAMADGVARIRGSGADLLVIEPLPRAPDGMNPLTCLGGATYQEECRFRASAEPYWVEQDLRGFDAADDHVWSVDLDRVVCPDLPVCEPFIDGLPVRWDAGHLTRAFGMTLVDDLTAMLAERGLLE
jgi:peptidoglycan/LPS O-acetylase OafA/YrhL